ncbi:MAG: hypothetical protein EWM50_07275 [Gottschalkiaceae bacterium]|nr:MAG: hypothetical protein EWM50_07275 [Gottschalkiaceae bacterium]
MTYTYIKAFVKSDGKITEFSFDRDTKTVRAGEEGIVIFDGNEEGEDINKTEMESSMGIIGGADGPTSIYISGNPLKAMIITAVAYTFIILAVGFTIGYYVKGKQRRT